MVFAVLLEGLQAFMPDRSSYYMAAVYSAAGVLAAALLAELFIRARRRFQSNGRTETARKTRSDGRLGITRARFKSNIDLTHAAAKV